MKREKRLWLLLMALGWGLWAHAQGYVDVTSAALLNPSFELSAAGTTRTATASDVTEVYGWTIPTSTTNNAVGDATTEGIGFTNVTAGGVKPSDGNYFFWNRKGWSNLSGSLSTTTNALEAGTYYVVFDYKAADYSNNTDQTKNGTTMNIVVTDASGNALVTTKLAKRSYSLANGSSNPGTDTYMLDAPWTEMGAFFTLASDGAVTITVNQNLVNSGRSDICYDNFRLYRVYDVETDGTTSFPLDVTGTIANPSFEAGGSGGSTYYNYTYNGWTSATTGSEIRATNKSEDNGSYTSVYGSELDGNWIFNTWEKSLTADKSISQTVVGLPAGDYELSATVASTAGNSFSLFAGNNTKSISISSSSAVQTEVLSFSKEDDGDLSLGISSTVWYKADNFRLSYLGKSVSQFKSEYETALALAKEVLARTPDFDGLTDDEISALKTAINTTPEATKEGYQEATDDLYDAIQALVKAEYNTSKNSYGTTIDLGDWTTSNQGTNSGQHWDGTTTSTYYEQASGWSNSSWSMSMTQDVTLAAGKYVLRATGRHSSGDGIAMTMAVKNGSTTLGSVSNFPGGDTGLGVNKSGVPSFVASDATGFANSGAGRGWQWRYVPFELTKETTVTISVTGEASAVHQWMSITAIELSGEGEATDNFDANTTEATTQVTTDIHLTEAVDYTITSEEPFTSTGRVYFENDDATLILSGLKPSEVDSWLAYIYINGEAAQEGTNCSIRIYGNGAMIVPYGDDYLPLTVYKEENLAGESTDEFGPGQRVSLSGNDYNNAIRSFKLKRGYMACMASQSDGTKYSRVWVADKKHIKVNLPTASPILDKRISSIRVMKWNDVTKKGYAGNDYTCNQLLNTTWCYNWDAGNNVWDDIEYVTQHHHEGWPNIWNVGYYGTSANALGNNEPDNTGDAREQVNTVDEVLANWQEMMATGKRLGSPAMSSNLSGWLYPFIDSIDARGWRCDYVAVHAYWYSDKSSWLSTLKTIHERTKRPIWITEMNYGANWTGWPGDDTTGSSDNYAIELNHFGPICDGLEETDYIERYAAYNWVQDCRKLYNTGDETLASTNYLTPMGVYYAGIQSAMAYDSNNDVVPPNLRMVNPTNVFAAISDDGVTTITFDDDNQEFSDYVYIERLNSSGEWEQVVSLDVQDESAAYSYSFDEDESQTYRIHTIDFEGEHHYSSTFVAGNVNDKVGSEITMNGETYYLGGNLFVNGEFDMGGYGWSNGEGTTPPTYPGLEVIPFGSVDDSEHIKSWVNEGATENGSLLNALEISASKNYYYSVWHNENGGGWQKASLSSDGTTESSELLNLSASTNWKKENTTFNSGDYTQFIIKYRWLAKTARFDKFILGELFSTQAEAFADGTAKAKLRAEAFKSYNTEYEDINTELTSKINAISGSDEAAYNAVMEAVDAAIVGMRTKASLDSLLNVANTVFDSNHPGATELQTAIGTATAANTVAGYAEQLTTLTEALNTYLYPLDKTSLMSKPAFESGSYDGWTVKSGTYTGGDQRINTLFDQYCWNAWWATSISDADGKTMAIQQDLSLLPPGYYMLDALATTQHYCLSDQHAFATASDVTTISPTLTFDRSDMPEANAQNAWERLTTLPVYVGEDGALSVGFISSKEGAVDGACSYADNREGWWYATDFGLTYCPAYKRTVKANRYGTVCLPFAAKPGNGVKLYKVAGINSAKTTLYIDETTTMEAGKPYIFLSETTTASFYGCSDVVDEPVAGDNGLTGIYRSATGDVPNGSFILSSNKWMKVDNSDKFNLGNFRAYITSLDEMTIIDPNVTTAKPMSVIGGTVDGIQLIEQDDDEDPTFTTDGKKARKSQSGLHVGKGKKFVKP